MKRSYMLVTIAIIVIVVIGGASWYYYDQETKRLATELEETTTTWAIAVDFDAIDPVYEASQFGVMTLHMLYDQLVHYDYEALKRGEYKFAPLIVFKIIFFE